MKFNKIVFAILFLIIPLTFTGCEDTKPWIGTYEGRCLSYYMEDGNGEWIEIYNHPTNPYMYEYVEIPEVYYTFEIYDNNLATIRMISEEIDEFSCHNIDYSVSKNENGFFSLTMFPEVGSDCGGNEIVLTQSKVYLDDFDYFRYTIEEGASGKPSFIVTKWH